MMSSPTAGAPGRRAAAEALDAGESDAGDLDRLTIQDVDAV